MAAGDFQPNQANLTRVGMITQWHDELDWNCALTPACGMSCNATLNLTTDIINRLLVLKSLLELGDLDLVHVAAMRLEGDRVQESIGSILLALENHQYADATALINQLLSDGTRVALWIDPEISLLEVELEKVTSELADFEAEQAELEHLVYRFEAAHNAALGARIRKLLELRLRWMEKQIAIDPTKQEAYEQANRDFEEFEQDQKAQKEDDIRSNWELSENEQKELKRLFRKGSKKCHPDLVAEKHRNAAARMFRELRDAYDRGDLKRVQQLVDRVESGLFDAPDHSEDNETRKKARLKAKIAGIREVLEKTKEHVHAVKSSKTYQMMTENADWAILFENECLLLDQEIARFRVLIEDTNEA